MSIYAIKPAFQKLLDPINRQCISLGVSATALNVAGTLFAGTAGVLLFLAPTHSFLYAVVPVLLFLRIAANALDGMVARSTGISSARGAYLNELGDRISDLLFLALVVLSGHGGAIPGVIALAATPLVSFAGTLSHSAGGSRIYVGIMGKPDRMFVLGASSVLSLFFPVELVWSLGLGIVAVGALVTIVQRIDRAWKELGDESL